MCDRSSPIRNGIQCSGRPHNAIATWAHSVLRQIADQLDGGILANIQDHHWGRAVRLRRGRHIDDLYSWSNRRSSRKSCYSCASLAGSLSASAAAMSPSESIITSTSVGSAGLLTVTDQSGGDGWVDSAEIRNVAGLSALIGAVISAILTSGATALWVLGPAVAAVGSAAFGVTPSPCRHHQPSRMHHRSTSAAVIKGANRMTFGTTRSTYIRVSSQSVKTASRTNRYYRSGCASRAHQNHRSRGVQVGDDHELFLCYSRRDSAELCTQLCHWFRSQGVRVFCDLVDDPDCALGTRIYDVIQGSSAVLFVASPDAVGSLHYRESWISRELACAAEARRNVILLRLPGADQATCERLRPANYVATGGTPLSAATLRSLLSACTSRPLLVDNTLNELMSNPSAIPDDPKVRQSAVAQALRRISRSDHLATDIRPLWPLLRTTVSGRDILKQSSQGFYTLTLHAQIERAQIRELIRLHIWTEPEVLNSFSIHSHQPHATSWVLSGTFTNTVYRVNHALSPSRTSLFDVRWDSSGDYNLHHNASTVTNTGQWAFVEFECSATFTDGQSYTVPAGEFHSTRSAATNLPFAATLFFFDSAKGWTRRAPVVGPTHLQEATQPRQTKVKAQHFLQLLDSLLS